MTLDADGRLRVRIDDLDQNRQIEKDKVVDAELLRELRDTLGARGFFDLNDKYEGAPSDQHVLYDVTLVLGRNAKRVKVFNKIAPTGFTEIREILETFAQNELGLAALSLPPEQARLGPPFPRRRVLAQPVEPGLEQEPGRFVQGIPQDEVDFITTSVLKNQPLGSDAFKAELERKTKRQILPAKRGRPFREPIPPRPQA